MKNWHTLEPDQVKILSKHYTRGRGGARVEFVTIHHMAMVGGLAECVRVWQDRAASAHYTVDPAGVIGQAVWDRDTAWSNANAYSNARSISIEHSNSAGAAADWPIGPKTLEAGAHLTAAICVYYKLGRPVSGKNVRFHSIESRGMTSCPYHLRPGGKYHDNYMRRAQFWYDQMTKPPAHKEENMPEPRIKSLINPRHEFTRDQLLALNDAAAWKLLVLVEELCRRQGIDPAATIDHAISEDRKRSA